MGGKDRSDVIDFAVATELIHTATLIHDDIYDGAKLRRGVQTLHEKHGLDHAIIGGDFLFVMGFGIGGRYDEHIVRIMADTCAAIASGELKQLQHVSDLSTTPEDYYEIVRGKTAGPFSSACECAAIIAGASESEIESMREFGMELGIAFQLVDDLLDLTGDVLGEFHDERWGELEELLESGDSFGYCNILIHNHLDRALEHLHRFPESEVRDVLESITRQVMTRND